MHTTLFLIRGPTQLGNSIEYSLLCINIYRKSGFICGALIFATGDYREIKIIIDSST